MTPETLTALFTFAFVSSITPGPNNIMLMASGTNYGIRRTIPHILGVNLGFTFMLILVGIGLSRLFISYPISQKILQVLCVSFLVYLSYKIATAAPPKEGIESSGKPMTFLQAVLFQWVNPKAWTMTISAMSIYSPSGEFEGVLQVALAFWLVNLPCISIWVFLGRQIRRFLVSNLKLRIFNMTMASLLMGSLYFVFFP